MNVMNIKMSSPPAELDVFESRVNAINTKSMMHAARKEKKVAKKAGSMSTKCKYAKLS